MIIWKFKLFSHFHLTYCIISFPSTQSLFFAAITLHLVHSVF